jgi:hypothetical protein
MDANFQTAAFLSKSWSNPLGPGFASIGDHSRLKTDFLEPPLEIFDSRFLIWRGGGPPNWKPKNQKKDGPP